MNRSYSAKQYSTGLTREEEEVFDPVRDTNKAITNNIGLVRHITVRYVKASDHRFDDLVQEGLLGLREAAKKYESERGRFHTYATWWIKAYVGAALRKERCMVSCKARNKGIRGTLPVAISLDDVDNDGNKAIEKYDSYEFDWSWLGPRDARKLIQPAMSKLDDRKRQIIKEYFINDLTYGQIGSRLNITNERVRQLKNEALSQLHTAIEEANVC